MKSKKAAKKSPRNDPIGNKSMPRRVEIGPAVWWSGRRDPSGVEQDGGGAVWREWRVATGWSLRFQNIPPPHMGPPTGHLSPQNPLWGVPRGVTSKMIMVSKRSEIFFRPLAEFLVRGPYRGRAIVGKENMGLFEGIGNGTLHLPAKILRKLLQLLFHGSCEGFREV